MNMVDLPAGFVPGAHYALPFADYLAIDALSASGMKRLLQSPLHYQADRLVARKPSAAMNFGIAAHLLTLEPDRFALEVVAEPRLDRRTKAGKQEAEEWEARNAGRLVFDAQTIDALHGAAGAVRAHPAAGLLFSDGHPEVSLQWVDAESGAACKARVDWLRNDFVPVDLKTTGDASPAGVVRAFARGRYHIQAAHYMSGVRHVFGTEPRAFVFVFVERDPPHAVACYVLPADALAVGAALCARCMNLYVECRLAQQWPGYSDLIETIELPPWAM